MTYSPAKIDAFARLEDAIENLRAVYFAEHGTDPDVLAGWVLITSGVSLCDPDPDDPDADDADMAYSGGWFARRGQAPTLSLGIVHKALLAYEHSEVAQG